MFNISIIKAIVSPETSLIHNPLSVINDFCFDSRKLIVPHATLFFAIVTSRNDGHKFIEELVKKGVENFIVTEPLNHFESHRKTNFLQVKDSVFALQQIAAFYRQQFTFPVVGITGSNGKTIVKEWITQMATPFFNVVKSPNSFNSQIGVPVSVLQIKPENNLAIFEAGISKPHEMAHLEDIIRPTIGILTTIGEAHNHDFNSLEEKLKEKLILFKNVNTIIYCKDHQLIDRFLQKQKYQHQQKISWGTDAEATYCISHKKNFVDHITLDINDHTFTIPFTDPTSIENTLHSIVFMLFMEINPTAIQKQLYNLKSLDNRMEIIEALNDSVIINDTYSLDMTSLKIALDFLNAQNQKKGKTLIISDFEQVKALQDADYKDLNLLLHSFGIHKFIAIGQQLSHHADCFDVKESYFFEKTEKFIDSLSQIDFYNETMLIKGARNFHFEQIIERLQLRTHQTVLTVHLPSIIHNLNYFRSLLKPKTKITAVVKALCYGLGDMGLIEELSYYHVDYFAVAYVDEGVMLRKRNITKPIIVLGAEVYSFEVMIQYLLEPEIFNINYLRLLDNILNQHAEIDSFNIHIKLDTGMHRLGFDPEELDELINIIKKSKKLKIASLFSHLAASEDVCEQEFTLQQIANFETMSSKVRTAFPYPIIRHLLNSTGIVNYSQAQYDMVRLGLGLYGLTHIEEVRPYLENPITLKTYITQLKKVKKGEYVGYNKTFCAERDSVIAIIPIGYADGYSRLFSNGIGKVTIKGQQVPVVGRISMDMTTIDVTDLEIALGEEVVIYGSSADLQQAAQAIGTIPYELLTTISMRVKRVCLME
ncbi:MAG: bifunctional UDP-N-acetylmuramoyl-tripeptide:D-alanyl-D-alanine ligase/alanine racemase [Bacteroidales bacterium]|jgi:alanine racemase|nr:bifunctional UDP-N-acetylmuramoyl-tripeptide:D-alanyl-D-alanine ligase/alanine racemase [Bacteroidales bacterium]